MIFILKKSLYLKFYIAPTIIIKYSHALKWHFMYKVFIIRFTDYLQKINITFAILNFISVIYVINFNTLLH